MEQGSAGETRAAEALPRGAPAADVAEAVRVATLLAE